MPERQVRALLSPTGNDPKQGHSPSEAPPPTSTASLDDQASYQAVTRLAVRLTHAERVSLLLLNPEGQVWMAASHGCRIPSGVTLELEPGIALEALATGRAFLVEEMARTSFPCHPDRGYTTDSCMAAALAWQDSVFGVVCATGQASGAPFTREDLAALQELAGLIGVNCHIMHRLRNRAEVDSMTGLLSRRAFESRLAVEAERSRRFGRPLSLIFMNIDNFRRLNELGGHRAGDEVLRRVAWILMSTVRTVDIVARYGGDEFVALLPETGDQESMGAARRLLEALQRVPAARPTNGYSVRVSMGIASRPSAKDSAELVERAYLAMKMAKGGRDGFRHWDLGTAVDNPEGYVALCHACGRKYVVATSGQQRTRRYCSLACAARVRREAKGSRNQEILEARASGLTLKEIGDRYGISEERVRQICSSQ